jgi:hypothetical protein
MRVGAHRLRESVTKLINSLYLIDYSALGTTESRFESFVPDVIPVLTSLKTYDSRIFRINLQ